MRMQRLISQVAAASPPRRFKDKQVQRDAKMVSYEVVNNHGRPYVQVQVAGQNKTFSPEEISAMVLSKMKETAGDAS